MDDLIARPAWAGLDLPATHGGVTLAAAPETPMLSIAPYRGRGSDLAGDLGADLPAPGRTAPLPDGSRLIWAGLDAWLLRGPAATRDLAARLSDRAAVTDQSDGWTGLILTGAGAADVLARLVPLDLASEAMPPGATARTELRHILCALTALDGGGYEILVMRSFTASAVHEIGTAMRRVAARRTIRDGPGPDRRVDP